MSRATSDDLRIMLALLASVERDGRTSQRRLSAELGIALGLVNSYLKRCIRKGLVKASQVPARRYAYYLTPKGIAEKSKLTVDYLSHSLGFFRQARSDCAAILREAEAAGHLNIVLVGKSDLAEIMTICVLDSLVQIVGVVDADSAVKFAGHPVFTSCNAVIEPFDAVVVTGLLRIDESYREMVAAFGQDRVYVPDILRQQVTIKEVARA